MVELRMDDLTGEDRDVLNQIAIGQDAGHPDTVLTALAELGLIVGHEQTLPGWPPVQVVRWEMPIGVHIQWAQWCADQPDEET